jgi:hypothetical protein
MDRRLLIRRVFRLVMLHLGGEETLPAGELFICDKDGPH